MRSEAAQLFADYNDDLVVRNNYSGRCMYGETTTAVVGTGDLYSVIADIIEDADDDSLTELAIALRGLRTDSMGRGQVWY